MDAIKKEEDDLPEDLIKEIINHPLIYSENEPEVTWHDPNEKQSFDVVDKGIFGGIFTGSKGGMGGKYRHAVIYDPSKIADSGGHVLDFNKDLLSGITGKKLTDEQAEVLGEYLAENENIYDLSEDEFDEFRKIYGLSYDRGEASYDLQRMRGAVAKGQGFAGVKMDDETGTSILLFKGHKTIAMGDVDAQGQVEHLVYEAWKARKAIFKSWRLTR